MKFPIDVRIVCATHQDLQALIGEAVSARISITGWPRSWWTIPPLRDARRRCMLLAHSFVQALCQRTGRALA
jgi:two-component system NtrC family response regulator